MDCISDQQKHDSSQVKYKCVNQPEMKRNQCRSKDHITKQSRSDHKFESIPKTNNNNDPSSTEDILNTKSIAKEIMTQQQLAKSQPGSSAPSQTTVSL